MRRVLDPTKKRGRHRAARGDPIPLALLVEEPVPADPRHARGEARSKHSRGRRVWIPRGWGNMPARRGSLGARPASVVCGHRSRQGGSPLEPGTASGSEQPPPPKKKQTQEAKLKKYLSFNQKGGWYKQVQRQIRGGGIKLVSGGAEAKNENSIRRLRRRAPVVKLLFQQSRQGGFSPDTSQIKKIPATGNPEGSIQRDYRARRPRTAGRKHASSPTAPANSHLQCAR